MRKESKKVTKIKRILALVTALSLLLLCACGGGKNDPSNSATEPVVIAPTENASVDNDAAATPAAGTDQPATDEPTSPSTEIPTGEPTEVPTEIPTEEPTEEPFVRPEVKFSDMQYERPDSEGCLAKITAIKETVSSEKEGNDKIVEDLTNLFMGEIADWNTMYAIANIYFAINPQDEYWSGEMSFYDETNPLVENKYDELLVACARSKYKADLEEDLFGPGELDRYVDGPRYTEKIAELRRKEAELVTKFMSFDYENLIIEVNGYRGTPMEIIERIQLTGSYELIEPLYESWMSAINSEAGSILVDLIKVRHEIAAESGYSTYEEYAFKEELLRDYTPEQAARLAEQMRDIFAQLTENGLYSDAFIEEYSSYMSYPVLLSYGEVMEYAEKGFEKLDSSFSEVFKYMEDLELCYIGYESEQAGMSFTTFIQNYYAPYIVIEGSSDISDLLTFVHEFGHFYENYNNLGSISNLDQSEVASTALVFLFSRHLDEISGFNSQMRTAYNAKMKLDLIDILETQSMYYMFEHRIYALDDSELTLDRLNKIAGDVAREFGYDDEDAEFEILWPMISHFYMQPFYVISYVTSMSVSLQMYDKELSSKGSGLEMYINYIESLDPYVSFVESIENAGFKSPFTDEGMEAIRSIIKKIFQ